MEETPHYRDYQKQLNKLVRNLVYIYITSKFIIIS